jgi:hypothetical protein
MSAVLIADALFDPLIVVEGKQEILVLAKRIESSGSEEELLSAFEYLLWGHYVRRE